MPEAPVTLIANARMYAVTPAVERLWATLLTAIGAKAGLELRYEPFAAPAPLDRLWVREDLGLAFMCGWPLANLYPKTLPVAAPAPAADWARGRPDYRTDLVVATDRPFRSLADTYGTRLGWTVEHSQSGFRAVREHLRESVGPDDGWNFFSQHVGPLVTPRRVIEALLADEIDVGPLDAYWHDLLKRHEPETASRLRTIASTRLTPMPLLVASSGVAADIVARLQHAAVEPANDTALRPILDALGLRGFEAVTRSDYEGLRSATES